MSILVKNNIHWVGQRDWEVRDFHGTEYKTLRGSSYTRKPQHPVQQGVQPGGLPLYMRLCDLRHQQNSQTAQQPKGEIEQRQCHAL